DLFLDTISQLKDDGYYLVTVVGNDERELENRRYKIYYVFSHPMIDLFVILEYLLDHDSVRYCSIQELFPAVDPFQREIGDLLGLWPDGAQEQALRGSWLHD